ncbi:MAG: aminodeoxychorismate synthase component I [Kiritimatiellae bacterium]|nr:aminodeoxychorismate synthase component I [Kiritimatiellia bacterium]
MSTPRVVLRDNARKRWLSFSNPCRIVATRRLRDVVPLLEQMEDSVRRDGTYAAGFISYDAAAAFDPCLTTHGDDVFPLIWFGLFARVESIRLPPVTSAPPPPVWRPSVAAAEYTRRVEAVRSHIREGDTYQANYTYRLRAKTSLDPWLLFRHIVGDDAPPFAAFVDTGEWAVCSASPELFLRIFGERIESRPMKGTAARGLWQEQDLAHRDALLRSPKEQAENVMIVDMVRNDFGRIAIPGSVRVSTLFAAERYPSLWQMTTTVRARTRASLTRILEATFPPASVTGAPKRRTMAIIAEQESSPRRVYTGAIGFVAPDGRAQFNVAIRTVLVHKPSGHAEYGVGSGIVWDSRPQREYEECLTKTKVLRSPDRGFELVETMLWSPRDGYARLSYHLRRLASSARYFGFRLNLARVRSELDRAVAALNPGLYRVRLRVARHSEVHCEAVITEQAALRFGDVVLARRPVDTNDVFLYHKTTNRQVYDDALRSCPVGGDVLLFNAAGEITECTIANVAVELDDSLYTPPVRCGLLAGTYRASLLERGELRERVIGIEEAVNSPNVFLMNAVRGMHKVRLRTKQCLTAKERRLKTSCSRTGTDANRRLTNDE